MTMKKSLFALLLITGLNAAQAAPVQLVDRIVAVVNKSVITSLDLQNRLSQALQSLKDQHVTPPPMDVLQHQVLDQMITEEVQTQFAASNNITIDNDDVDAAIQRVAQQNKLNIDGLKATLNKQGIAFDTFRTDLRRELLLSKLKESVVGSRTTVSDNEVNLAMKNVKNANNTEFQLANLLIDVPERANPAQIDSRAAIAHQALNDLNNGKAFGSVAAALSNAPNAMRGGDLGWRPAASLPPDLVTMLDALKPGQHTDVIRTQQGFYIFQLVAKRKQDAIQMAEQYHVYNILLRTNEAVSDADAKNKILQIRDKILRGASFADMAKLYSQDGSSVNGGDLGWQGAGDTVPEFEKIMTKLPLNTVSEPVRTQFGWHLLEVVGKRDQNVTSDRLRSQIRQQLRTRKLDEAYTDWVQQQRDASFIDNRLNEQ